MFGRKKWHVHSAIDKKTEIKGDILFEGGMQIDGRVQGNVIGRGKDSVLIVGPHACIEGRIQAQCIVINGEVIGPVLAFEQIMIKRNGKVRGAVTYGRIQMEEGASVEGHLLPHAPSTQEERSQTEAAPSADHSMAASA